MERRIATGLGIFVVATMSVTLAAGGASATPGTDPAPTPRITWEPCEPADPPGTGAECGMLDVPLDYSRPDGKKIQLALSRFRAKSAAKDRQGVVLTLAGGPGNSGRCTADTCVPSGIGDAYDWVGYDPRGVGASVPALSCDNGYFDGPRPDYVPRNPDIERSWLDRVQHYADACRSSGGALLDHMTTLEAVRDVESIREALGVRELNLYGFSYGTYVGQVYATLYPKQVRRMVLDSTVDPRDVWYRVGFSQDVAFERNLRMWFGWVAKYDDVYHLGRTADDVQARWYAEQNRLRAAPAGGVVGPAEFTDIFVYAGYYQWIWPSLADLLAAASGDSGREQLVWLYQGYFRPAGDNGYAVYNAVQCSDARWPQSWPTWQRDNWSTFQQAPFATWDNAWYNAPCLFWPAKATKPVTIDGSKVRSVLFVDGTLDAATPFEGSLEARRRFPHGSLLAEVGQSTHANSLNGNPCITGFVADYLATGALPPRQPGDEPDASCDALPQPVPASASARALRGGGPLVPATGYALLR
ncbi:alpha/beta fold hydrolase [Micromonospora chersina]|uniref:alpha/beta fold hydrolase n=1 Tax=Micromonospora chersina TaxID=47854 RepID=UPI00340AF3F2